MRRFEFRQFQGFGDLFVLGVKPVGQLHTVTCITDLRLGSCVFAPELWGNRWETQMDFKLLRGISKKLPDVDSRRSPDAINGGTKASWDFACLILDWKFRKEKLQEFWSETDLSCFKGFYGDEMGSRPNFHLEFTPKQTMG